MTKATPCESTSLLQASGRQFAATDDAYIHPPAPLPQAPLVPGPLAAAPLAAPLASPTPQPPAVAVDDAPVPAYTDLPTLGTWANFWAAPSAPSTTPVAAFPTAREHLVFGNFASEPSALLPVEGPMDQAAPAVAADPPAVAAAAPAVAAAAPAVALPLAAPAPAVAAVAVVTSAALPAIAEAPAAEEVSDVPWAIPAGRASSPSPVEPPTLQVISVFHLLVAQHTLMHVWRLLL